MYTDPLNETVRWVKNPGKNARWCEKGGMTGKGAKEKIH